MLDDSVFRKSVIASVVAAVIVLLVVQPLLTRLLGYLAYVASTALAGLSDQIYQEAALGEANSVDMFFLGENLAIILGVTVALVVAPTIRRLLKIPEAERGRRLSLPRLWLTLSLIVLSLLNLKFSVVQFARLQLNVSFRQRLSVVEPYVSDHESKELTAMWATMRNRTDYERVNTRLEGFAQKYSPGASQPPARRQVRSRIG